MVARKSSKDDITLRDVVLHMGHMEQRLSAKIDANTADIKVLRGGIDSNGVLIQKLGARVDRLEENLTARIDALEEDLTATIKDTVRIRQHVGMPVPGDV